MAATDMSKAGLEVGCKVEYIGHSGYEVMQISDVEPRYLAGVRSPGGQVKRSAWFYTADLRRDYDDAQTARQARVERLVNIFPITSGVPEDSDTIERYCGIQAHLPEYALIWSDDLDELLTMLDDEVLDDWMPRGVYDLDTGAKIDVHISSPVVTVSEDSPCTVNELDADEVAKQETFIDENYDVIAHSFDATFTVDPAHADAINEALETIAGEPYVEQASIRRDVIRQYMGGQANDSTVRGTA